MSSPSSLSIHLSTRELRALIRQAKGGFAPDYVAQHLKDIDQGLADEEGEELAGILHPLITEARAKLFDDGVEPWMREKGSPPRLPKRERERASNLSRLLAFYARALSHTNLLQEAETAITEGIGWGRVAGNLTEESRLWMVLAQIHQFLGRLAEEEEAISQALRCAREKGDSAMMLFYMDILVSALVAHRKPAQAAPILDEAFELINSVSEEERQRLMPGLLIGKGRIAVLQKNEREAIATFREALRLPENPDNPLMRLTLLTQLGIVYAGLGEYEQNIVYQRQMIQLAQTFNDNVACSWGFFRIGESYLALGDLENAEKALNLSWEYAPEVSQQPQLSILAKRAQICRETGKIEEGISYSLQILEAVPEREAPSLHILALLLLGQLEAERGNPVVAESYLRRALEIGKETETPDHAVNVQVRLAEILLRLGRAAEGEELLKSIDPATIRTATDQEGITLAYGILAECAEMREDFREALHYTRKEKEQALRIAALQAESSLQKARVLAEVELYEREAQLERERRKQMEHELAQAMVSIDNRQHIIERVERQLQKTLSFLATEKAREVTGALKDVLMQLDSEDEGKEHALQYVGSINNEFTIRLRERWPDLTRKQERLCGLIRAGLTSQEIFKLLGISYEGLRAQRKRLRKVLGLEADETLETVIGEI